MKNFFRILAFSLTSICFSYNIHAQEDEEAMLLQLEQNDQTAIDAIAMYPEQTRGDILEASKYPEVVVRLDAIQKTSKEKFTELLAPYSKEEQEKIWNLTRYPALISDIAFQHPKSEDELNGIVMNYPEEIRATALEEGIKNYDLLNTIAEKNKQHEKNFDDLMRNYPPATVGAYKNLISQPEILNILSDNMQMTVLLGDLYRNDPQWVLFKTDSLNKVLTQQNTHAAAEWQKSLNENPQALKEYQDAAQQYAQENNVQPTDYNTPYTTDISGYPTYSYNWWYGYPTWYPYSYWDPYPYWYDLGFYYGPGRIPIFFGMPSAHFMNWYFYHPANWSRYPVFGNHCYSYYENHPGYRYSNNVSRGVNEWRGRNRDVVNEDWNRDQAGRTERFRQFGKMETSRNQYNAGNPQHQMERSQFANQNRSSYPSIKVAAVSNERSRSEMHAPNSNPRVNVPASFHQDNSRSNSQDQRNNSQPQQSRDNQQNRGNQGDNRNTSSPSVSQHSNTNQTRNAQQFHQSTWQGQSQPHNSQPAPHPVSQPNRSSGGGGNRGGGGSRGGGRR
jgi:hypothetical protein